MEVITMLMPDVTAILYDPELGAVDFQVRRVTNTRVLGSVQRTEQVFDVVGNIQPQEKAVQSSTVEDLSNDSIVIRAIFDFKIGNNQGDISFEGTDEVLWDNKVWRVTRVEDWSKWGFSTAYAEKVMDYIPEDSDDSDDTDNLNDTNTEG